MSEARKEAIAFLKGCETFYLATVEGDQPRVRPFGAVNEFEDKLYLITGFSKDVTKQMLANPKVEICGYNGKAWVRIAATVVSDERLEAKQDMLDEYPSLNSMYTVDGENTAVFYLKDAVATYASFTEAPKTVRF